MNIGFIGYIVVRPCRTMITTHLNRLRDEYELDFVIANYENASHGFGLTKKNAEELFSSGIDVMSGGNHTFDRKDIFELFGKYEILRPNNYPKSVDGTGLKIYDVAGEKFAVLNLLGHYGMPHLENAFICAKQSVEELHEQGVKNIFIDFHAEATSEKRALMAMLEGKVSAICGTHTHVSSDDLQISKGTAYLTDIGLTGCRDNVIGMDKKAPLNAFLTGIKSHFDVPKNCNKILQMLVYDINEGICKDVLKIKLFDNETTIITKGWLEN